MERNAPSDRPEQIDEEEEISDFLPEHLKLEGRATLSAEWEKAYCLNLHRTMEDPRFLVLPPTGQLLYLHLLKKTHGIGLHEVAISIDRLVRDTKLAWATIQKQVKCLSEMGVIVVQELPRQRLPTKYLVGWLPPGEEGKVASAEVLTRYDQLDRDDHVELKRLGPLFSQSQREKMAADIYFEYRADGILPSPAVVKKIISYRILNSGQYKRVLKEKHPDWYGLPANRKSSL